MDYRKFAEGFLLEYCHHVNCKDCAIHGYCKSDDQTDAEILEIFSNLIKHEYPKQIKIKYFVHDLEPVVFKGDWCDLRAGESVDLKAGECKLIRLGVGMILPEGYEAHVVPRSSTAKNFGVIQANHMGVIDNKYSGDADEWHFPAVAIRDTHIEKGERICQFRIVKNQPEIKFEVVDHLNEVSRGGIGSTGKT